jgi:hypothetical protein
MCRSVNEPGGPRRCSGDVRTQLQQSRRDVCDLEHHHEHLVAASMRIRIENTYSDGHEPVLVEDIPEFDGDLADEEELNDHLWPYAGDGHGDGRDLDAIHTVTVLASIRPELVGRSVEWG